MLTKTLAVSRGLIEEERGEASTPAPAHVNKEKTDRDRLLEAVAKLHADNIERVRTFVEIVRRERGCATPAEDLITHLVFLYKHGITPETLEDQLDPKNQDGFRVNFDEALKEARHLQEMYPKMMQGASSDPSQHLPLRCRRHGRRVLQEGQRDCQRLK